MHLLSRYSLSMGAKIDEPYVNTSFFPLPFNKYIVLSPFSSNMPAKNYRFWNFVLDNIAPILANKGISIVHLGGIGEPVYKHCLNLAGKTTFSQSAFLVKNSLALLGIDSFLTHVASALNVPLVSLYSVSCPSACGPFWGDRDKQILLQPNFNEGETYYYNPSGPDKVNTIKPEQVIHAIGKILNLSFPGIKTLNIGAHFDIGLLDIVPNCVLPPNIFNDKPLSIRYDKGGEENNVYKQLSFRRCVVLTDKPLNTDILSQLRQNVERIIFVVKEDSKPDFIAKVANAGIQIGLISRLEESSLNLKKLDFSDVGIIEQIKPGRKPDSVTNPNKTFFKTGKRIISREKMFLSYAHELENKNLDNPSIDEDTIVDSDLFWNDIENYLVYEKE